MHRNRSFVSVLAVSACSLAVACSSGGDDTSPDDLGTGAGGSDAGGSDTGTGGKGGAGHAGSAGHAGAAGSAGHAGMTTGTGGHAGTTTGTGGHAGTGGSAGTGTGGHAGTTGGAAGTGAGGSAGTSNGGSAGTSNGGSAGTSNGGSAGKGTGGTAGTGAGGNAGTGTGGTAGAGAGGAAGKGTGGTGGAAGTGTGGTAGGSAGTGGTGVFMPPTTCDDAHGFTGCCSVDRSTLFYFKTTTSVVVSKACTAGKVCGWDSVKLDYGCIAPPSGDDPSGANPIECGGDAPGNSLCTGAGGAGGAAGSGGNAGAGAGGVGAGGVAAGGAGAGGVAAGGASAGSGGAAAGGASAGAGGAAAGAGGASAGAGGASAGAGGAAAGAAGVGGTGGGGAGGATDVHVVSVDPSDSEQNVAVDTAVTISFNVPMDPATLSTQMTAGACAGNVQISCDNFATCIATDTPSLDASGEVLTVTPTGDLAHSTTCKVKVTTGATDTGGHPLSAESDMGTGFTTVAVPAGCTTPSVVISQIYGGGGNTSSKFKNDFIELYNRSNVDVVLTGWSVQYTSSNGTAWAQNKTDLTGTIKAGGYFLIQEAAGSMGTDPLPTPDTIGTLAMSASSGKVALVSSSTGLAVVACPTGGALVDLVGYGGTGATACVPDTAAPSATTSVSRKGGGCVDSGDASADFTVGVVNPRNSGVVGAVCAACM